MAETLNNSQIHALKDFAQDTLDCLDDFIEQYAKPNDLLPEDVLDILVSLRDRARDLPRTRRADQ